MGFPKCRCMLSTPPYNEGPAFAVCVLGPGGVQLFGILGAFRLAF